MKKMMVAMAAVLASMMAGAAIDQALADAVLAKGRKKIAVWPEGKVPAQKGKSRYVVKNTDGGIVRLSNVDIPELAFFPAPGAGVKPCVLVCPGGGYSILAYNHEGVEIADELNRHGFSAFVLKYRCPAQANSARMDAQRALSLIRSRAAEWKIDPNRLGMMGFSAGANLTCWVSTTHKARAYAPIDEVDTFSCRPDFSLPIYPWDLVKHWKKGEQVPLTLKDDLPVDKTTPPAFIVQTEDDGCQIENSLAYYAALKRAGVKAEMHLYARGGHGYGVRHRGADVDGWEELAAVWLKKNFGNK